MKRSFCINLYTLEKERIIVKVKYQGNYAFWSTVHQFKARNMQSISIVQGDVLLSEIIVLYVIQYTAIFHRRSSTHF